MLIEYQAKGVDFMALQKLVCNVEDVLLKQVDEYAASLHITRTAAVSVLLSTALQAQRSINALEDFMRAYKAEQERGGDRFSGV